MGNITDEQIKKIGEILAATDRPLKERFRALFTLKNIGGKVALKCIAVCFADRSALLKHELAYCLGQMRDSDAIPILRAVLENKCQPTIVRHEAGEALGAIGTQEALEIVQKFTQDQLIDIAETCQLATARIKFHESHKEEIMPENCFHSVDPAPPLEEKDVSVLEGILCDDSRDLFERYRAMFALRNINSKESVAALCNGINAKSALMRHEIAFVLGQLQTQEAIPTLVKCLEDKTESPMVRHECAEALGVIATDECREMLEKFQKDEEDVVKESCIIALDMCEYENTKEFQYANTLQHV